MDYNFKINKKICISSICILAILFLFFVYQKDNISAHNEMTKEISDNEIDKVVVSSMIESKSLDDLEKTSQLIVEGELVGEPEYIKIKPTSGGDARVYTQYNFKPNNFIRNADALAYDDTIKVRVLGGQIGDLLIESDTSPIIKKDDDVILFLYKPNMGSGYNTEGDYYYINGLYQGVFYKNANNEFVSSDTFGNELETINLNEYQAKVKELDENGFNIKYNDEIVLENFKRNLDSGFITQEEYDRFVAETKIYAQIVQ